MCVDYTWNNLLRLQTIEQCHRLFEHLLSDLAGNSYAYTNVRFFLLFSEYVFPFEKRWHFLKYFDTCSLKSLIQIYMSWKLGTVYFMTATYTFKLPWERFFITLFLKTCSQLLLFRRRRAFFSETFSKHQGLSRLKMESQSVWNYKSFIFIFYVSSFLWSNSFKGYGFFHWRDRLFCLDIAWV